MARRAATKRLRVLIATFKTTTPVSKTLQEALRDALSKLQGTATEFSMGSAGSVRVNTYEAMQDGRLCIRLIKTVPGESATTVSRQFAGAKDTELPEAPPKNRSFKHGDFYALIADNNVVCCTDRFHARLAESYLQRLLIEADPDDIDQSAVELESRLDMASMTTLAKEGVKTITLDGVAFLADVDDIPAQDGGNILTRAKQFLASVGQTIVESVSKELTDDAINHLATAQVKITIHAEGGKLGNASLLQGMHAAGKQLLDDDEEGINVSVETEAGSVITPTEMVLSIPKTFHRKEDQDCLDENEVFPTLEQYHTALRKQKLL